MEREFHHWLIENFQPDGDHIEVGLGDDAAVVRFDQPVVITSDTIADGVHFDFGSHSLEQIGHKAIAVSISDIAAMGAKPVAASVDFFLPSSLQIEDLKSLFGAIANTSLKFDCQIIGGDTNRWNGPLVISTTLYGKAIREKNLWRISGGNPGDHILVTGRLGGSILKKHVQFEPRVNIAQFLAQNYDVTAATDITDSLALDLTTLARASGCGFMINGETIPISDSAHELAQSSDRTALDHALYDGEDFELIVCLSHLQWQKLKSDKQFNFELFEIGKLTPHRQFQIEYQEEVSDLEIRGYEH